MTGLLSAAGNADPLQLPTTVEGWAMAVTAVGTLIAGLIQFAPKLAGHAWETVQTWSDGARRADDAAHMADIRALEQRLERIEGVLADTRAELDQTTSQLGDERARKFAHDRTLSRHAVWDHAVISLLVAAGIPVPEQPPLWPHDDRKETK